MAVNIYINGRFLTQKVTGVQRYAAEVVRALDKLLEMRASSIRVCLLTPARGVSLQIELKNIATRQVGIFAGHLWEQVELPFYCRDGFLLSMCNPAPIMKLAQAGVVHDAIIYAAPESTSFLFRNWYKMLYFGLRFSLRRIITDSEFSKRELVRYMNASVEKFRIVHAGCDHVYGVQPDWSILDRLRLAPGRYVFAVGSINPHKNFKLIVDSMEKLKDSGLSLVIAGGVNPRVFRGSSADFPSNVKYAGYVSDRELKALYSKALCFVYPSFYEGFGLPPLEAMACGCPVVVSDRASLPEVCGEAAAYVDPDSADDLVAAIKRIYSSPEARRAMSEKGLARAALFTWESTAKNLLSICVESAGKDTK